jgi:LPS sulfotransferase NodH
MRPGFFRPAPPDLFARVVVTEPERQARLLAKPAADLSYVIHFTPRSGSSWLSGILAATGRLSAANEAFNPNFVPRIAHALQATDMDLYIRLLRRRFNTHGVYGVEVTAHQINRVFGRYARFHDHFGTATPFWLIRQDIVAQAVSLAKMVHTEISHARTPEEAVRAAGADATFAYDAAAIGKWLHHIRVAETASERWFARYGLSPLRMSYEQITALAPLRMVNVVARHIGVPDIAPMDFAGQHSKLGTDQNTAFAERFRQEESRFLARLDRERAPMLARLHPLADMVRDL